LDASHDSQLRRGCDALGLILDDTARARLGDYLALLGKWNRVYNLTAVRDEGRMISRHLLDSLAVAPHLPGTRLLDVGSGAGLPGVPLAVAFPEREFHLLDSSGKKARFLFQVKTALCLDNMKVHQGRVEAFTTGQPFDTVVSRAFASLSELLRDCRRLVAPGGHLLAMKGRWPGEELAALDTTGVDASAIPLRVPGLDEQRHLVDIRIRSH